MMKKTLIFLFVFCACSTLLLGQKKGYNISLKIENTKDTSFILGNYYANNRYAIDTAYPNKKGLIVFENKEKELLPGLYFIVTSSGRWFDFVIYADSPFFSFETKDADLNQNMVVKKSEENRIFYDFQKRSYAMGAAFEALRKNSEHLDSAAILEKQKALVQVMDSFKINYMKEHPDHLLSLIFKATKEIDVPKIVNEKGEPDLYRQYLYYREHYFANVALNNDAMIRTSKEVFYERFMRYFDEVLKNQSVDTIIKYVDMVIEKAEPSKEMFKYIVYTLADKYLKSNIMGYEAVYVHIIKKYYVSGKAFWATPSDIESEGRRADIWEKLLIGKPAIELVTNDTNDKPVSLYGTKANFTLLIFWSPECGHCSTIIPEIHKFYLENKSKYGLEVIAVNTDLPEIQKWKDFIKKHDLKWINTHGTPANIDWKKAYDVNTTPVIYLFDEQKKIIGKRLGLETLKEILEVETKLKEEKK